MLVEECSYLQCRVQCKVEVGLRGLPNMCGFEKIKKELKLTKSQTHDLMVQAARRAMLGLLNLV